MKLDETTNFLDLYVHAAGRFKTPAEFHLWAALALVAGCLEDRVYMSVFEHAKLYPNTWTFLIGGSGVGKDHAIGLALSLIEEDDPIMVYDGKTTIPGLYDILARRQKETHRDAAPLMLVSSDLPEQLPPGPESVEFTSRVLPLYGGRKRILRDYTRTKGVETTIRNPLLTWLAGCVPRWFPRAIHPDVFHSGFAGRALFIHGVRDEHFAHLKSPMLPPDYELVRDHLRQRVAMMQQAEGPVRLTKLAMKVLDAWLLQHAEQKPDNDIEEAIHERKLALVLKITMALAMCDWFGGELVAKAEHVSNAIQLLPTAERGAKQVGNFVYKNQDTMMKETVEDVIRSAGKITRARLMKMTTDRGVKDAKHLDALIDILVQSRVVSELREKQEATGRWIKFYSWNGKRGLRLVVGRRGKKDKHENVEAAESSASGPEEADSGGNRGDESTDDGEQTD